MKRILVTGGAGFIGRHVCKQLLQQHYEVLAVDNLVSGNKAHLQCPLHVGDITDKTLVSGVIEDFRPEAVVHLAAHCNPMESIAEPQVYYHNITAATVTLLDAMIRHGVKKIIFASSSMVYAEKPEHAPYTEGDACQPTNPYATSKWTAEKLIEDYGRAYGLDYVIMRHFDPSGSDIDGDMGESLKSNHAVAAVMKVALGVYPEFTFYGTDYPTPDGTSIRDYVHVTDIARAHTLALDYLAGGNPSFIVNIASGCGTSLKQLLEAVQKKCGHPIPVRYAPRRDINRAYLVGDISQALEKLKWKPVHSSLDTILDSTFRWFLNDSGQLKHTG